MNTKDAWIVKTTFRSIQIVFEYLAMETNGVFKSDMKDADRKQLMRLLNMLMDDLEWGPLVDAAETVSAELEEKISYHWSENEIKDGD